MPPDTSCILYLMNFHMFRKIKKMNKTHNKCFFPGHVPKFQGRVVSEKKRPLPGRLNTVVWIWVRNHQDTSQGSRVVLFLEKKHPARKPAHRRANLRQKLIFPKVDFQINDPSQIEAACLLTPPASSI